MAAKSSGKRGNPNWKKGGPSPNPTGKPRDDGGPRTELQRRRDGWYNATTGVGTLERDKGRAAAFCSDIVTWGEAADYWRGDDLAARIIETLPNEMLRQGFDLRITCEDDEYAPIEPDPSLVPEPKARPLPPGAEPKTDLFTPSAAPGKPPAGAKPPGQTAEMPKAGVPAKPSRDRGTEKELQEKVSSKWEDLGLVPALWDCLAYERAYGGAAMMIGAQDGRSPDKPLDIEKVRSIDWLTVLEPREISPWTWYNDPTAPKFGKPELYQVTPTSPGPSSKEKIRPQTYLIHESRLIVFTGIRVSRIFTGQMNGWGDSVLTRCINVLTEFNFSFKSASTLLQDFAQAVYKIEGLAELFVNNQDDVVKARIKAVDHMRSTIRAILIDKEEEFERKQTPVSGMPELLDRMVMRLCAAADMPRTMLMGESPGGLGSNGESEIRMFYDRVRGHQDRKLRPAIERLCKIIFRALGEQEPDNWSIYFKPLWQPTEKEQAETRYIQAQADEKYITAGVVSPEEVAKDRFGGDEWSGQTTIDFEARARMEPVAEGPAKTAGQVEKEQAEADQMAKEFDLKAQVATSKVQGPPK